MGRHKTTGVSDETRAELYEKYIKPNHRLVRTTVSMLTQKKTDIDDNFQESCMMLLRYIDTYSPDRPHDAWIITNVRRFVGKLESRRDSYTDAIKGSDTEYVTTHSGYKAKYRPNKAKDFVNTYDENFRSDLDEMIHDGVEDDIMSNIKQILPSTDFGGGSYKEIIDTLRNSEDLPAKVWFMRDFDGETYVDISRILDVPIKEVKLSYMDITSRLEKVRLNRK